MYPFQVCCTTVNGTGDGLYKQGYENVQEL